MIYINPYLSVPINTIIGGVAGTISTKAALAVKLGISESIIKKFQIVGSDVHARIGGDHNLGVTGTPTFQNDTSITSFLDIDGLVKTLSGTNCFNNTPVQNVSLPNLTHLKGFDFYNCTYLTQLYLPSLTTCIGTRFFYNIKVPILNLPSLEYVEYQTVSFRGLTLTTEINMKKLKTLGDASTHNDCFTALKTGCYIRVNVFMATSNSGAPHAALVWAKANRAAIVEFYDDAGNYVSTL